MELITKILWHTKNIFFANLTNKVGIMLIHPHRRVIVLLAIVIFYFDNLRGKEVSDADESWVLRVLKILAAHQCACCDTHIENCCSTRIQKDGLVKELRVKVLNKTIF